MKISSPTLDFSVTNMSIANFTSSQTLPSIIQDFVHKNNELKKVLEPLVTSNNISTESSLLSSSSLGYCFSHLEENHSSSENQFGESAHHVNVQIDSELSDIESMSPILDHLIDFGGDDYSRPFNPGIQQYSSNSEKIVKEIIINNTPSPKMTIIDQLSKNKVVQINVLDEPPVNSIKYDKNNNNNTIQFSHNTRELITLSNTQKNEIDNNNSSFILPPSSPLSLLDTIVVDSSQDDDSGLNYPQNNINNTSHLDPLPSLDSIVFEDFNVVKKTRKHHLDRENDSSSSANHSPLRKPRFGLEILKVLSLEPSENSSNSDHKTFSSKKTFSNSLSTSRLNSELEESKINKDDHVNWNSTKRKRHPSNATIDSTKSERKIYSSQAYKKSKTNDSDFEFSDENVGKNRIKKKTPRRVGNQSFSNTKSMSTSSCSTKINLSKICSLSNVDARKDASGRTLLIKYSRRGDISVVRDLIKYGANVNHKDNAGWTALHESVLTRREAVVSLLLASGADPNARGLDGNTPLHDADGLEYENIARLLLKYGASVTICNDAGISPLCNTECAPRISDLLQFYLKIQNSLDLRDSNGMTLFHRCCSDLKLHKLAKELLQFRRDRIKPNTVDNAGWTPLHEVVNLRNLDLVILLLEDSRVEVNAAGYNNKSALSLAIELGHTEISKALSKHGGKEILIIGEKIPYNIAEENILKGENEFNLSNSSSNQTQEKKQDFNIKNETSLIVTAESKTTLSENLESAGLSKNKRTLDQKKSEFSSDSESPDVSVMETSNIFSSRRINGVKERSNAVSVKTESHTSDSDTLEIKNNLSNKNNLTTRTLATSRRNNIVVNNQCDDEKERSLKKSEEIEKKSSREERLMLSYIARIDREQARLLKRNKTNTKSEVFETEIRENETGVIEKASIVSKSNNKVSESSETRCSGSRNQKRHRTREPGRKSKQNTYSLTNESRSRSTTALAKNRKSQISKSLPASRVVTSLPLELMSLDEQAQHAKEVGSLVVRQRIYSSNSKGQNSNGYFSTSGRAVAQRDADLLRYVLTGDLAAVSRIIDGTISENGLNRALFAAIHKGFVDIVRQFVERDVEFRSSVDVQIIGNNSIQNTTPLHHAIAQNQVLVVKYLLSKNAPLDILDGKGNTPEDVAMASYDPALVILLQNAQKQEKARHKKCKELKIKNEKIFSESSLSSDSENDQTYEYSEIENDTQNIKRDKILHAVQVETNFYVHELQVRAACPNFNYFRTANELIAEAFRSCSEMPFYTKINEAMNEKHLNNKSYEKEAITRAARLDELIKFIYRTNPSILKRIKIISILQNAEKVEPNLPPKWATGCQSLFVQTIKPPTILPPKVSYRLSQTENLLTVMDKDIKNENMQEEFITTRLSEEIINIELKSQENIVL